MSGDALNGTTVDWVVLKKKKKPIWTGLLAKASCAEQSRADVFEQGWVRGHGFMEDVLSIWRPH